MVDEEPPSGYEFISKVNDYYQNLLGYSVEQTRIKEIPVEDWMEFVTQRGFKKNSSGIYLPRNQTAIIPMKNKLSLFHEYFGHGLFCEQSLIGKKLVDLEKTLLKEEEQRFQGEQFTLLELNRFRGQNKTFEELNELREQNLGLYEIFATWTEYFLSKKFEQNNQFEKKYDSVQQKDKTSIDELISFSKIYGDLATFYNFGMARKTTPERVSKLLFDIYGEKLKEVKLAVLYGSRKEFSDIDVFIVSEDLPETDCSWLDVRVERESDFEKMIKMFDVSITGLAIDSEFIIGDKNYFEKKKRQLAEQSITEEAIKYNLEKSEEQKRLAMQFEENSRKNIHGLTYSLTYLKNAIALKQNRRLLPKELLYSQSESIKMKGGLE